MLRRELAPLLQQLGVAAYLNGHDHGLELHRPGGDSGPVYALSGGSLVKNRKLFGLEFGVREIESSR